MLVLIVDTMDVMFDIIIYYYNIVTNYVPIILIISNSEIKLLFVNV